MSSTPSNPLTEERIRITCITIPLTLTEAKKGVVAAGTIGRRKVELGKRARLFGNVRESDLESTGLVPLEETILAILVPCWRDVTVRRSILLLNEEVALGTAYKLLAKFT